MVCILLFWAGEGENQRGRDERLSERLAGGGSLVISLGDTEANSTDGQSGDTHELARHRTSSGRCGKYACSHPGPSNSSFFELRFSYLLYFHFIICFGQLKFVNCQLVTGYFSSFLCQAVLADDMNKS